ncbi:MAG TPA: DinB family protein, partial [Arenibacter sp.]|nr:DinB family protein [Arenibacter sp.]
LFDYNFYCNKKLIEGCNRLEYVPEKSIALFSHILNTHHIWNSRMLAKKRELDVFQIHTPTDWEAIHYDNQRNTFDIITHIDRFEKRFDYETTEGMPYSNTAQEMLFHIINHSTHHRAQISVDFRNNGIQPLALDYIYYKR